MNSGKKFEKMWKDSINQNSTYYLRLKDSPSSFNQDSTVVRFTAKNPYDHFCFYRCFLFPLELKHTRNGSFSIQREKTDKNKMIKLSQIEGLTYARQYYHSISGFVFDIEHVDEQTTHTYWLDINDFNRFLKENDKKSINEQDILRYNPIVITTKKKKVNYHYEIQELFDKIIEREGD